MTSTTALAIREEQQTFTVEQVDALKRQINGEDIPDAELAVFFHQAKRAGLDPFAKQIYLIPRWNKRKNRNDYTIQTSIDGMRLIADRTGAYAGSDRPIFEEREGGKDKCAIVTVYKMVNGQRCGFTAEAWWSEFVQTGRDGKPSNLWASKPRLMLAKCAEALALRKAFPADLSGLYADEEMHQADSPSASVTQINPELEASVARHPSSVTGRAVDVETGEVVDVVEPASAVPFKSNPLPGVESTRDIGELPDRDEPDEEFVKLRTQLHAVLNETFALPPGKGRQDKINTARHTLLGEVFNVESTNDLSKDQIRSLIQRCKANPSGARAAAGLPEPIETPGDAA